MKLAFGASDSSIAGAKQLTFMSVTSLTGDISIKKLNRRWRRRVVIKKFISGGFYNEKKTFSYGMCSIYDRFPWSCYCLRIR